MKPQAKVQRNPFPKPSFAEDFSDHASRSMLDQKPRKEKKSKAAEGRRNVGNRFIAEERQN